MKQRYLSLLAGIAMLVPASMASASGFALIEQSASGLGNAYAGGAAAAEDASTVFYNPAGMVLLKGQQVSGMLHYIVPAAKFEKETAHNVLPSPFTVNYSGGNGGDAGGGKLVPNLFYTARLNNDLAIGLGISTPFGLVTEYDKNWVGRYHAVTSDVMTININPSVAYRINDQFSVGAGLNAQYFQAELSSMIDGGLSAYVGSGYNAAYLAAVSNTHSDIYGDLKGDSWGFGYNLGILYTPTQDTRIGLAYRSQTKQSLKGDATFTAQDPTNLVAASLLSSTFTNRTIKADITLPDTCSLSIYHRINQAWAIMGDVSWTQWSTFDKLVINYAGTADYLSTHPTVTTENWRDTWRFSTGVTYNPTNQLTLRTGLAYDQAPVKSAEYRTPRIPDNDRIWLAVGAGYKFNEMVSFDFGYAHLFVQDADINKSAATPEDVARGTLTGTYSDHVDIVSTQLNIKF